MSKSQVLTVWRGKEGIGEQIEVELGSASTKRAPRVTILDPFAAAHRRGQFSNEQYGAGVKFNHHFERGGLWGQLYSLNYSGVFGKPDGSHLAKTEDEAHHRLQYRTAEKLLGMTDAAVLRWVICEGIALHGAGERLGWTNKPQAIAAAVQIMRGALDKLCGLWGI